VSKDYKFKRDHFEPHFKNVPLQPSSCAQHALITAEDWSPDALWSVVNWLFNVGPGYAFEYFKHNFTGAP
jgi:hypothetical protein